MRGASADQSGTGDNVPLPAARARNLAAARTPGRRSSTKPV